MATQRIFVIQEPSGAHPKMETTGEAGLPSSGMSLFYTRKIRKLMATLTNPKLLAVVPNWNVARDCNQMYLHIESDDVYTASELLDAEFAP